MGWLNFKKKFLSMSDASFFVNKALEKYLEGTYPQYAFIDHRLIL
jgi:hypothetical protein